jgi:hypothetical protein
MKKKLLLLFPAFICYIQFANAQGAGHQEDFVSVAQLKNHTAAKGTAATGSRLISQTDLSHDGVTYAYLDSTRFTYSGTRGSDYTWPIGRWDNNMEWVYNTATSSWTNAAQSIQTFNASDDMNDRVAQLWNSAASTWDNNEHTIYTYDAAHNVTTQVVQHWNAATTNWNNYSKTIDAYDANNNVTGEVSQTWNTATSAWDNLTNAIYTYDASNNKITEIDQSWVTGNWQNTSKETYTYDANNNMLTRTYQTWSNPTSSWANVTKNTYTYGPSNELLNNVYQYWSNATSTWGGGKRYTYSNFTGINPGMRIWENWNNTTSSYENALRTQYTYNAYGQYLSYYDDTWNVGGFWQPATGDGGSRFEYETYTTSVKNLSAIGGDAKAYPVPASNMLNIDLDWNNAQPFTVSLIDMTGRVNRSWQVPSTVHYQTAISVADLPYGNYFLNIEGANGRVVKQIVVSQN